MEVIKAFLYGVAVVSVIVILGIIGWGFSIFMTIISNAIWGLVIVIGIVMFFSLVFSSQKESE